MYDIIIHISDNYTQTLEIEKIMKNYEKYQIEEFINLKYFLKCNFKNNKFDRCDILIRKYSIEKYLLNNDYSFDLYKIMQKKRTTKYYNKNNYIINFKKLIESIKKNGFNNNFPVKYSHNYLLRDGSHRLSYLLILKPNFIKVEKESWDNHGPYDLNWFIKNNFSEEYLNIIKNELENLNNFLNK